MHSYKNLDVWKKSIDFTVAIYNASEHFPKTEQYGLTSQIRRASVSISSNISEGAGRGSKNEFKRFLRIAKGSACEVETQLIISKELKYLKEEEFENLEKEINAIKNMLFGLDNSLQP